MPTLDEIRESLRTGKPLKGMKSKIKGGRKMVYLGEGSYGLVRRCVSTHAPSLDRTLCKDVEGQWGVPFGRSAFVMGKPSSGKTTLCLHLCANVQKQGGLAIYIDAEHKLDRKYATKLGVNVDELLYTTPETLEEILETIMYRIQMIREIHEDKKTSESLDNVPIIIIVDSASIATESERKTASLGGSKGEHARILSKFLRVTIPDMDRFNILTLFVCQIKSKIQMGPFKGNPETFLGEEAIKFQSTLGIRTQRIAMIKNSDGDKVGDNILFRIVKNQVANPMQEAKVDLYFGKGLDYYGSLCDLLVDYYGAKKKAGGNYELKKFALKWKGKRGLRKVMKDKKMRKKIIKLIKSPTRIKV